MLLPRRSADQTIAARLEPKLRLRLAMGGPARLPLGTEAKVRIVDLTPTSRRSAEGKEKKGPLMALGEIDLRSEDFINRHDVAA
jgi:hypothetical protein